MMNPKCPILITLFFFAILNLGFCREFGVVTLKNVGQIRRHKVSDNSYGSEINNIARFAIEEHNKKSNSMLEFGRVLKAKEQLVAGKIYLLTLEAIDAGKKTVYEAKVWVKPWINFKQLQEFKRALDVSHFTASDLSIMRDGFRWHKVPVHDPEVQDAANFAVRTIQQRSNCLSPYQLLEILQAEAEVVKDFVKYDLLLKMRRGTKEEKLKVKVHKNAAGNFLLSMMELHDV